MVWLFDTPPRGVDNVGRPLGWPGSALIARAAQGAGCGPDPAATCDIARLDDGRSRCRRCGAWWSASQVARYGAVARSDESIGVDIEDRRRRPGAYRRASVWCGVDLTTPEQWTQAEALWKAMGLGHREPAAGEIPLSPTWQLGWQPSRDGAWWLYSDTGLCPWSVAVPRHGRSLPPSVSTVRKDY
jgi:hypothetical protein